MKNKEKRGKWRKKSIKEEKMHIIGKKAKQKEPKRPERGLKRANGLQKQENYGIIINVSRKKLKGECYLF